MPPVKDTSGDYKMNSTAPLSNGSSSKPSSPKKLRAALKKVQPFYKCIPSDEPALKAHVTAPASAPSISTLSGAAGAHMQ